MVEGILDATTQLLKESSQSDAPRLTTNRVAKQAGISVGSLYQYFPNIESILYDLYQRMTDKVIQAFDKFDTAANLALPREEFFEQLNTTVLKAEADPQVTISMHQAVKIYPGLQQIEQDHSERVAEKMAAFLKYYGSNWPTNKLKRLALYIYYVNYGTWVYREHVSPPIRESTQWELGAIGYLIELCFEDVKAD